MALLHLPLPSLLHLFVRFKSAPLFQHSLESFPNFSPNVKTLHIHVDHSEDTLSKIEPNYITRWQNLCSVTCSRVILDMADLVHLSRVPALTKLEFALGATLPGPAPTSLPIFSKLRSLTLHAESLAPISQLLCQVQLPTLMSLSAKIVNCPSDQDLTSFLSGIPASNVGHTMERLHLDQSRRHFADVRRSGLSLGFEDLQPCMALSNLREMELDIACNVDLTDGQILTLASAWPKLECLIINERWSWNMSGGITPGGLVQLLETCHSLTWVSLRLDTREVPPSHAFTNSGWAFPPEFSIQVLDSAIQAESVSAVAAFFCNLATCYKYFGFIGWSTPMMDVPNEYDYQERWDEVHRRIGDARRRSTGRDIPVGSLNSVISA